MQTLYVQSDTAHESIAFTKDTALALSRLTLFLIVLLVHEMSLLGCVRLVASGLILLPIRRIVNAAS